MEPGKTQAEGSCDHLQPSDVARMAENYLREKGVPDSAWDGCRFGLGGPAGAGGPFKSVYIEVERRSGNWVAVKLDRRKTELGAGETELRVI